MSLRRDLNPKPYDFVTEAMNAFYETYNVATLPELIKNVISDLRQEDKTELETAIVALLYETEKSIMEHSDQINILIKEKTDNNIKLNHLAADGLCIGVLLSTIFMAYPGLKSKTTLVLDYTEYRGTGLAFLTDEGVYVLDSEDYGYPYFEMYNQHFRRDTIAAAAVIAGTLSGVRLSPSMTIFPKDNYVTLVWDDNDNVCDGLHTEDVGKTLLIWDDDGHECDEHSILHSKDANLENRTCPNFMIDWETLTTEKLIIALEKGPVEFSYPCFNLVIDVDLTISIRDDFDTLIIEQFTI